MLPEVKHPMFKLVLPSDGRTIAFRPYTVREEKLFLTARMSEDFNDAVDTLKQILRNCIFTEIDIDSLPMFDIEWIFLNLRKNSVSNVVDLYYDDDGKKVPFQVDLADVKVYKDPAHKTKFQLADGLYVQMNYPNMADMLKLEQVALTGTPTEFNEAVFHLFLNNVEALYDDEKKYEDFSIAELEQLVLSLPISSTETIRTFFDTMPILQHTVKLKTSTGEKEVTLRGLRDFFTF